MDARIADRTVVAQTDNAASHPAETERPEAEDGGRNFYPVEKGSIRLQDGLVSAEPFEHGWSWLPRLEFLVGWRDEDAHAPRSVFWQIQIDLAISDVGAF